MRKILVGSVLFLAIATLAFAMPARADGGLTGAVASAWFPRAEDAGLHTIAHQRVMEISACKSCMNHDGMRAGTAEVLGYNAGYSNPIAKVVASWASSPVHNGILSDRSYGRIGCAERVVGGEHWFVCVLATGGWTGGSGGEAGSGNVGSQVTGLPDTAMR
jgi:hypothetical protein